MAFWLSIRRKMGEPEIVIRDIDATHLPSIHEQITATLTAGLDRRLESLSSAIATNEREVAAVATPVERRAKERLLSALREERAAIINRTEYSAYVQDVAPILAEYERLGPIKKIVRLNEQCTVISEPEKHAARVAVVLQYLAVANKYYPIRVLSIPEGRTGCSVCRGELIEAPLSGWGALQCRNCRAVRYPLVSTVSKASNHTGALPKAGYEDRENFRKALLRYQGKQPVTLAAELFTALDKYFGNRAELSRTRENMFIALKEMRLGDYYQDINLICNIYWGWPLPDVSELEDQIMEDYDQTQLAYESIPDKGRKSSLNVQFRLWKHLEARGHPCQMSDFKIVTTEETFRHHEELWRIMARGAGISFGAGAQTSPQIQEKRVRVGAI